GQVRARQIAYAAVGSTADDQWSDIDIDAHNVREKRRIGGALGKSAVDGYSLCAHAPWRDRVHPRRAAAARTGMQKRAIPKRIEAAAETLSRSRSDGERLQIMLLEKSRDGRPEPNGVVGSALSQALG